MKNLTTILITLALAMIIACGSGESGDGTSTKPPGIPPQLLHTIGFSCLSVDNDQACTGKLSAPGVWESGPVAVTGYPPPDDYINIEITNGMAVNATVFVYECSI